MHGENLAITTARDLFRHLQRPGTMERWLTAKEILAARPYLRELFHRDIGFRRSRESHLARDGEIQ